MKPHAVDSGEANKTTRLNPSVLDQEQKRRSLFSNGLFWLSVPSISQFKSSTTGKACVGLNLMAKDITMTWISEKRGIQLLLFIYLK